jgi:hypothetical protein
VILRTIGAQFAPRLVQRQGGLPPVHPRAGELQKALLNRLKQRILVLRQNGAEALIFANHSGWAKTGTILSCFDDNVASFRDKSVSYK